MNELFETSNEQFNCNLCDNEEPFYIPVERFDMISLRVNVPYNYVTANGGGLPSSANVAVSLVDETGTTTLCNYGTGATRLVQGNYNDGTNKVAQYQLYMPIPFASAPFTPPASPDYFSHAYFVVNQGDHVKIVGGDGYNTCDFIFGIDTLPANFYMIKPTTIAIPYKPGTLGNILTINGTPTTYTPLYGTLLSCDHEYFSCFRVKIVVTFVTSSQVLTL